MVSDSMLFNELDFIKKLDLVFGMIQQYRFVNLSEKTVLRIATAIMNSIVSTLYVTSTANFIKQLYNSAILIIQIADWFQMNRKQ